MKKLVYLASLICVALVFVANASAEDIAISNASFEDPALDPNGTTWSDSNPDWGDDAGASGDEFFEISTVAFGAGVTGHHLANHAGIQNESSLQQDLTTNFANNTIYTLTVAVGNRSSQPSTTEALFQIRDSADNILGNGSVDSTLVGSDSFSDFSTQFTTGTAPTGAIRLWLGVGVAGERAHFDNIRLDATAVPEPASAMIVGLGAIGLFMRRRRAS